MLGFGWFIYWLVTKNFAKSKEDEYFTCKECNREFFKTHQVERNICKDCYKKNN
ncbi:MAG: hypothetical protein LBR43_03005 [Spiroplasmataceae bacterium]|nr:hypothetical protein [Spiroplasmataceae bacterium]